MINFLQLPRISIVYYVFSPSPMPWQGQHSFKFQCPAHYTIVTISPAIRPSTPSGSLLKSGRERPAESISQLWYIPQSHWKDVLQMVSFSPVMPRDTMNQIYQFSICVSPMSSWRLSKHPLSAGSFFWTFELDGHQLMFSWLPADFRMPFWQSADDVLPSPVARATYNG